MTEYMLKSSAALAIAYLLYLAFARRNTNFQWLRVYFLVVVAMSLALPALQFLPQWHQQKVVSVPAKYVPAWIASTQDLTFEVSKLPTVSPSHRRINFSEIVGYLYLGVLMVMLIRFVIGLSQLGWLVARNGRQRQGKDILILVKNLNAPFSFFHLIFINQQHLSDPNSTVMLQHERIHARQWHSLDLLLLEFITMVQWFNPFAWLIRQSLTEIHEYLADDGTVRNQVSPLEYQHLLLSQACGLKVYLPANGFNRSLTKKRILMITNNKRNRKWLGVFALLVTATIVTNVLTSVNIVKASVNIARTSFKIEQNSPKPPKAQAAPVVKNDSLQKTTVKFTPSRFLTKDGVPKNWILAGSKPSGYKVGVETDLVKKQKSVFLTSVDAEITGFGTLMQQCSAGDYLGKRIKLTGYIKAENVKSWAGMWLRVDGPDKSKSLSFDNMQDRPVKGTADWTKCEIVLDVPDNSTSLNFGILMDSTGKVWFANLSFEVVDKSVPLTSSDKSAVLSSKPTNLDFEN